MPYVITKDFKFDAAHRLTGLAEGHQCGRLHGHTYTVRVELSADGLDRTGFVLDYGLLDPFKQWVNDHLDHRFLNDVFVPMQPSAENLARRLYEVLTHEIDWPGGVTAAVAVSETPNTWAWYRPTKCHHHG